MKLIFKDIFCVGSRPFAPAAFASADLREYRGNCSQNNPQGKWVNAFSFAGNGLEG